MCGNGEGAVGWFVGGAAILVFNGAGGGDDGVVVRVGVVDALGGGFIVLEVDGAAGAFAVFHFVADLAAGGNVFVSQLSWLASLAKGLRSLSGPRGPSGAVLEFVSAWAMVPALARARRALAAALRIRVVFFIVPGYRVLECCHV